MQPGIINVTSTQVSDGFGYISPNDDPAQKPQSYLDSPENTRLLLRVQEWWADARDAHAENRREQMIDADYYDMIQWHAVDAAILHDRGQGALSYPIIKQMADWVIGTERKTRIDWDVLPRKEQDVDSASTKKQVLKWVSDVNGAGWERSKQFADQAKVGVGWTEECYNNDRTENPVTVRYQDWKGIWWDPYSRDNTLRDCRYIHRAKWLDLDYAISMFPDRKDELTKHAVDTLDSPMEMLELESSLPQMFFGSQNPFSREIQRGTMGIYGSSNITRKPRQRVLCLETWYRRSVTTQLLLGDNPDDNELNGKQFNPIDPRHQQALAKGVVGLSESVTEQIWCAIWTPGVLLRVYKSPYKHGKYPFTPAWAYRRHRDGMPYGIIRPARDAQDDYNKRRSKISFELATNLTIYESDAMDEADEETNLEEAKRADGEIRLKPGGLDKFKIDRGIDRVSAQIELLAEARNNIYEASGVTRENTGTSTGDQSGRAILAKQQQGAVTTAELFDNYRQAIQESGQKTLSNCEQFLSTPRVIRIVGPDGANQWKPINQPEFDPATGTVRWLNDITSSEDDFVVDETDYRETVRMAQAEMMFEMIGRMPPNVAMALLDVAVEMTDMPNKAAFANRIRQVTGQAPIGQENSAEAQAHQQAQAQAQQQAQDLQTQQQQAEIGLTQAKTAATAAKANLDNTKSQHTAVQGQADAMRTAAMVGAAPMLAQAADKVWNPANALPMRPNDYVPER